MNNKPNTQWELPLFFLFSYMLMIAGTTLYNLLGLQFFSLDNLKFGPGILWFVIVFSPTISALLLTWLFRGKQAVLQLINGYTKFNVHWGWYLAAFALLLVPLAISFVLKTLHIGGGSGMSPDLTFTSLLGWLIFNFFSGPFAEEAGWRGYALPRLQAKFNSTVASLILAFFWTLWHIPLAFIPSADQASFGLIGWIIYTVLIFTITVILTWLYNNTQGSFVIVILAHYCFNLSSNIVTNLLGFVDTMTYNIVGGIAGILYLIIIFAGFGYKRFSKLKESQIPIQG